MADFVQLQGEPAEIEIKNGKEIKVTVLRIYKELCKGVDECGICLYTCQKEVFKPSEGFNQKGYKLPEVVNEDQCTQCENCMILCPDLAIAVSGEKRKKGVRR